MAVSDAKPALLRLAIVSESTDESEGITNYIRNNGVAVRLYKPENADDISNILNSSAGLDLIIITDNEKNKELNLKNLKQVLKKTTNIDCPIILLVDEYNSSVFLQYSSDGADNIAHRENMEHIEWVLLDTYQRLEERRKNKNLLQQVDDYANRCDTLIDSSREPISYIHEGLHIRANDAYLDFFDLENFDDLSGQSLLDLIAPEQISNFKQILKQLSKGQTPPEGVEAVFMIDGEREVNALVEFSPAIFEGEKCVQVILRKKEAPLNNDINTANNEMLLLDPLTGLMNRSSFLEQIESKIKEISQENGENAGLLLFELDHYSKILQRVGLSSADDLIEKISDKLKEFKESSKKNLIVAKTGETQFAIFINDTNYDSLLNIAQQLKSYYSNSLIDVKGNSLSVTISIGGSYLTKKTNDLSDSLNRSHQLLHESLEESNKINIHDPEAVDKKKMEEINKVIDIINENIDNDGFTIQYQPLISLHGEPCEFYEMQTQIYDKSGNNINYMKVASEQGMLWEIDRWNVARALKIIKQRKDSGHDTKILLKISEASIQDDSMTDHIKEILNELKIDGKNLILELPESKIITYLKLAQTFRLKLSNLNVKVGLSQFGSGVDSGQVLNHFGADIIKISHLLSENLSDNKENQDMVKKLSGIIKEHGKEIIMENIEDAGSMAFLFSCGIHYVKGDFLGPKTTSMNFDF